MKDIAVFGSGGFGREVQMLIEQINDVAKKWNFIGFFDDGVEKGQQINGALVLGDVSDLQSYNKSLSVVLAIGNPRVKRNIIEGLNNPKLDFPILIHPDVSVGDKEFVEIGEGTIITAGNIITVNISIGKHVLLNLSCTVGHDAVIEDYCSIMPSVNVSGEVVIGSGTFIGTGAKIINQKSIGANTVVGAGAVVTKDLPANCTAVGAPAKPVKFHT